MNQNKSLLEDAGVSILSSNEESDEDSAIGPKIGAQAATFLLDNHGFSKIFYNGKLSFL